MTTFSYRSISYKLMKSGTLSYTNIYTTLPFDWQLFINNTTNDKLFYILAPTIPEVPLHQNCKKHSILIYITNILTLAFQLIFPILCVNFRLADGLCPIYEDQVIGHPDWWPAHTKYFQSKGLVSCSVHAVYNWLAHSPCLFSFS